MRQTKKTNKTEENMLIDNKLSNSTFNRFSIYSVQVDWLQKRMAYHSKYTDRNLLIEKKEIKKKEKGAMHVKGFFDQTTNFKTNIQQNEELSSSECVKENIPEFSVKWETKPWMRKSKRQKKFSDWGKWKKEKLMGFLKEEDEVLSVLVGK